MLAENTRYQNGIIDYINQSGGNQVVKSLITDKSKYGYSVKGSDLSPTISRPCFNRNYSDYFFGSQLTGSCQWESNNQKFTFTFQQNTDNVKQNYPFASTTTYGTGLGEWNSNRSVDLKSTVNRSLGNALSNGSISYSDTNQSSHKDVATALADGSYLLGLQTVNVIHNQDNNTYRPQLNTSYRRVKDYFGRPADSNNLGAFIPDDNSIQGVKSRTGVRTKYDLMCFIGYSL
jgi:hypothetical protein